jgi:hypothetical protein
VPVAEKPWWRQVDGTPPSPSWWPDNAWFHFGSILTLAMGMMTTFFFVAGLQGWWIGLLLIPVSATILLIGVRKG